MPATELVKLTKETKARIVGAKVYPRETLDDVIRRLLDEREQRDEAGREGSRQAS